MNSKIRTQSVKLIAKYLNILTDESILSVPEKNEILAQLKHLAEKGTVMPPIIPKLITQEQVAEMLSIGHSNFKKLEREGAFPFKRRILGSSIRYRNVDIISFIMASELFSLSEPAHD